MNALSGLTRVDVPDRAAWRAWLTEHHATSTGIWLVRHKRSSSGTSPTYEEVVEEALCFGWIDGRANPLDAERALLLLTPRKPKSGWSKLNKERVTRLIEQGLMTEAGLRKIEAARVDGSWSALDEVEALTMPEDLQAALAAEPRAKANFGGFSNSSKKIILTWIATAKRPETRQKRIAESVTLAAQGIKANHYRQ